MSAVQTQSVSSVTTSTVIPIDLAREAGINIGWGIELTDTPNLSYKVQHTFLEDPTDAGAVWFDHVAFASGVDTVNSDGNYGFGITGIRLNVTIWAAGTATIRVVQAGGRGR